MNPEKLCDAIGMIDPALVSEAEARPIIKKNAP